MLIDLPKQVRWHEMIDTLAKNGVSNGELARRVGVHKSAISRMLNDLGEPRFSNGVKILRVYVDCMQRVNATQRTEEAGP